MPDWLEICIPFGLIILGCIAASLIKKIASYHTNRLEEEQVQLLVDMADTFQELSDTSAESSISCAKFAESCREAAKTMCSNFTNKAKEKIEEMTVTAGRGEEKQYVLNIDNDKLIWSPYEIEPAWVNDRPRRLKCSYCGCISEKDYGTCDHCGAPLVEEEKEYMLVYHGKQL